MMSLVLESSVFTPKPLHTITTACSLDKTPDDDENPKSEIHHLG